MTTAARAVGTLAIRIAQGIGTRVERVTREEVALEIVSITPNESVAGMIAVSVKGTGIVEAALRRTTVVTFAVMNTILEARVVEMKAKVEKAVEKVAKVSIETMRMMTAEEDAMNAETTTIVEAEISRTHLVEGLIRMIEIGKVTEPQAEMTGATRGQQLEEEEEGEQLGEELEEAEEWEPRTVADMMSGLTTAVMLRVVSALLLTWNDETLGHCQPIGRLAPWAVLLVGRFHGQGRLQLGRLNPVSGYSFQICLVTWTMVS